MSMDASIYKCIAIQVGELIKCDVSINHINCIAKAIFNFNLEHFPNDSITSERAKLIYDWVLSLAKQPMDNNLRLNLLKIFLNGVIDRLDDSFKNKLQQILKDNLPVAGLTGEAFNAFHSKGFHAEVIKHARKLFLDEHYFHAVFEAAKAFDKAVAKKAQSDKYGYDLMMDVWSFKGGVLKLTKCQTKTDENIQEGIKFLSAGLMKAMRNPTSHETSIDWPITKDDCLDMLNFISYLFKQLDKAVYFKF